MMDTVEEPNSICHVQTIQVCLPFPLLSGEKIVHSGNSVDGILVLTNYRLFLQLRESQHHVPLGLIEVVEQRDLFYLHIGCKDARTYRCTFDNNEVCLDWFKWLMKASAPPEQLDQLFAFSYFACTKEKGKENALLRVETNKSYTYDEATFKSEVDRLKFNLHSAWRISSVNENYKLCPSYPPQLLVPACISDETLEKVAKFRSSRRIPTAVWRHPGNGAIIARCSQPEVGWLGWRSAQDEELLRAISDACTFDRGPKSMLVNTSHSPSSHHSDESNQTQSEIDIKQTKKVLIMDARSYTTAVANRARGGGCECPEYYPNCEIEFMYLANIHSIRKSFYALRQLCTLSADQPNWYSLLEGTRWLQHMSGLMKASVTLVNAVEREAKPVLVHCSDGWDRTPQIVALAELLLDPFYRTIKGFWILIERDWLAFGHKFADRCGHAAGKDDQNERCPVFLQWLDCVHQLLIQFPCAFEFSQMYLVKLAHHVYSNLFGTFLCNTQKERVETVNDNTFSVWSFLDSVCFRNHLYAPPNSSVGRRVLWPQTNVRDLHLWSEVYLGSLEVQRVSEACSNSSPGPPGSTLNHMIKTRSYSDLIHTADICQNIIRRKSDPNIVVDLLEMNSLNINPSELVEDTGQDGFLNNEIDVNGDNCNNDCMYKNSVQNLSDDSIDLLDATKMDPEVIKNGRDNFIVNQNAKEFQLDFVPNSEEKLGTDNDIPMSNAEQSPDVGSNKQVDHEQVSRKNANEERLLELYKENDIYSDLVNVISIMKTDMVRSKKDLHLNLNKEEVPSSNFESICLYDNGNSSASKEVTVQNDVNHNQAGELLIGGVGENTDLDVECTESSISKSERQTDMHDAVVTDLIDTSTDTLTSDNVGGGSSLRGIIKSETVPPQSDLSNGNVESSKVVCTQSTKFIRGKHSHHSRSTSGKSSCYSTPPVYSRTPSTNEWNGAFVPSAMGAQEELSCFRYPAVETHPYRLGDDGLVPLQSDMQERLGQIVEEQRRNEETVQALQRELQSYREEMIKRVCHKCNHYEGEKQDDTSSQVESINSGGEGQASGVESLRSDSWVSVNEGPSVLDVSPTHTWWEPDHAVSRCTGCRTEFWLGRRKHHCRKCGRIFCADCSENRVPLPSESLYDPVRVCITCYGELQRGCGEIPNQCKHSTNAQTTNTNQQITASSN